MEGLTSWSSSITTSTRMVARSDIGMEVMSRYNTWRPSRPMRRRKRKKTNGMRMRHGKRPSSNLAD